jgi:hypothetical protein
VLLAHGDTEVDQQVAEQVHGAAEHEDYSRRSEVVEEPRHDAKTAAEGLEEDEHVERLLIVAQRRPYRHGVDAEDVRTSRRLHDRLQQHEPPPVQDWRCPSFSFGPPLEHWSSSVTGVCVRVCRFSRRKPQRQEERTAPVVSLSR